MFFKPNGMTIQTKAPQLVTKVYVPIFKGNHNSVIFWKFMVHKRINFIAFMRILIVALSFQKSMQILSFMFFFDSHDNWG
jgi:hypothetical protein